MLKNNLLEKNKELLLWQKCLVTFAVLLLYRLLCTIPTPGVNHDYLKLLLESNASLGLLNVFSGNNLSSLSIMALNITPYISATIIIQLLQSSFDSLKRLARGTPKDKKKVSYITYALTAVLAVSQALGVAIAFGRDGMLVEYTPLWIGIVVAVWAGSAVILAIVGKEMDEHKNIFIGKGISLILLTNILSSFPANIAEIYVRFISETNHQILWCGLGFVCLFLLFSILAFLYETEKRIVVSYSSNVVYGNGSASLMQILPIKLMPASVMPIIFTSTVFSFPVLVATFTGHAEAEWVKYMNVSCWFNPENMIYSIGCILYVLLTFGFSYLYVSAFLNPYEIAEDLQKAGGFVSGLKTNSDTAKYFKKHIYEMASYGAIVLSVISVIPFVLSGIFGLSQMSFLGTSVLIVISVVIETWKDIVATKTVEEHVKAKGGLFNV